MGEIHKWPWNSRSRDVMLYVTFTNFGYVFAILINLFLVADVS